MSQDGGSRLPASEQARQQTVDTLCQAFAEDRLDVDDFERRVELAHRAQTAGELRTLLSDLPKPEVRPVPAQPSTPPGVPRRRGDPEWSLADPSQVQDQNVVMGVFGAGVRKGGWRPARFNYAIGVFGGVELDFRECVLPAFTEVRCFAIMGGVELIVPPDVIVETSGTGILGGFDQSPADARARDGAPEGTPVIRVTGLALMGGVDVQVRQVGESAKDAKRRRRLERKLQRRLERGG